MKGCNQLAAGVLLACVVAPAVGHAGDGGAGLDRLPDAEFGVEEARHLLMRAGFGGASEEVQRLHRLGLDGMVRWLVDYESRPDVVGDHFVAPAERPLRREILRMDEQERRRLFQQYRREDSRKFQGVRRWWAERLLWTKRPLEEKMTLFWHGHFTTSYRDVRSSRLLLMQNELLRKHATGNFGELLHAVSKDPAMLDYLDNNQNRRGRPNENYAREVMELFTLGLGNYTEQDIKEAARAFTGWTFARRGGRFFFNRRQHDDGIKTIFGKRGRFDGDDVCRLLLEHEACAPYVAGKIFSWFAYDPEPELAGALGRLLRSCRWELKPLLRKIFTSRAFYSAKARGTQVKSPTVLVVSTLRMLGMKPPPADVVLGGAQRLGQNLMMPPNVKGWEEGTAWITTASLLDRNNLCGSLLRVTGQSPGGADRGRGGRRDMRAMARRAASMRFQRWDSGFQATALAAAIAPDSAEALVDGFARRLLFVPLSVSTRAELVRFVEGDSGFDPKELRRPRAEQKLRKLIHLIMSTPEFQVC